MTEQFTNYSAIQFYTHASIITISGFNQSRHLIETANLLRIFPGTYVYGTGIN
ncbi:hypothetical protein [Pontibacter sp. SGAir0037]|uniref:hypothetical protein n=1 Tax=Pontibacter sp. SGAir0037 TaxID=2571030 RepID=UPI00143DFB42|nr:hypothetical protein [Pontibacter sp. SGAir0037]